MNFKKKIDELQTKSSSLLDPKKKSQLGQFYTPPHIAQYMASLFHDFNDEIKLLDAGCGAASLTSAFLNEVFIRNQSNQVNIELYDVDDKIEPVLEEIMKLSKLEAKRYEIDLNYNIYFKDFILDKSSNIKSKTRGDFTHIIMNPPYKKISANSTHRIALREAGIETVNLYTGFVATAIKLLQPGGELVVIIPRSFTNGPYYKPFRQILLSETSIEHIHIFDSRTDAFKGDDILQENIIIHCVKGVQKEQVLIKSSPIADFHIDEDSNTVTATDMTTRTVSYDKIVNSNDDQKIIHIATSKRDQKIIDELSCFNSSLSDLNLQVSTGPVVSFRSKEYLRDNLVKNTVPLIYPIHLNHLVHWPKKSKKPNAILVTDKTRSSLWENKGYFIIVKRFSSKDEKRRIVATLYDSALPGELIGFENGLNVFHLNKVGISENLAKGLFIYLNCTLVDKYYRHFGGHTQVNATDLKILRYPTIKSLEKMGSSLKDIMDLSQKDIDTIINEEIKSISGKGINSIMNVEKKISEALEIITLLGLPKAQQNERSALTFLALLNLDSQKQWKDIGSPMIGVTPIMDWVRDNYDKEYAPNTRETFRRQTLHQFIGGGLVLYNPDKPDRPVNSPKACYQVTSELFDVLSTYGTDSWDVNLSEWLEHRETLVAQYAMEREMQMIPLTLDDGTEIKLSPGIHSQLIHDIVVEFGPRFAPGSEVIYLGDTGAKEDFFRKDRLAKLGVEVDRKGKLPDVVLYWLERDWLLLIESVTSHGPVDGKRHSELSELFKNASPGLVYVTAFPDRKIMGKYLGEISWETEVWMSEAPTHMIHFNGDRFLGPH